MRNIHRPVANLLLSLAICMIVMIAIPARSLSQEHGLTADSHTAKATESKDKSATMAAQQLGLSSWMHGVESVGLSCTVSGAAEGVLSSDHLNEVVTAELKKIGLGVVTTRVAMREMKPFISVNVIRVPDAGTAEWRVQMRLHDRALRTDRRSSSNVTIWEFLDEDAASGAVHDPHKIESTVITGLRYFEAGVQESRKGNKQPAR